MRSARHDVGADRTAVLWHLIKWFLFAISRRAGKVASVL